MPRRADLARFAQGVHPRALTEHGLAEALRELADQAAVPVAVDVPPRRFPAPQEAAAYFVCSEALANVAKYAEATRASIERCRGRPGAWSCVSRTTAEAARTRRAAPACAG